MPWSAGYITNMFESEFSAHIGEKAHPGVGACQSKSKSWKLAGSLCDSGSIANIVRLLSARVEENERRGSPRWYPLQ
jgi:hypothetical protein